VSISSLSLTSYRNQEYLSLDFNSRLVCITGRNGVGKTNVIDAIHMLALCRSYFTTSDQMIKAWESDFYRIDGRFDIGQVVIKYKGRKQISLSDKEYTRSSAHLGKIPLVIITPDDLNLINGYSIDRRKWMDHAICQVHPEYLQALIKYKMALKQRNSYLKSLERPHHADAILLDSYDHVLVTQGQIVIAARQAFIDEILTSLQEVYRHISGGRETVSLAYWPNVPATDLHDTLQEQRTADATLRRTSVGPHKDELFIALDDHRAKDHGSQGQKKTTLFSLQLALADWMYTHLKKKPLLLLDDVFDKLDPDRVRELIRVVNDAPFEQIFMTDAHPTRLRDALDAIPLSYQWIVLGLSPDEEKK